MIVGERDGRVRGSERWESERARADDEVNRCKDGLTVETTAWETES